MTLRRAPIIVWYIICANKKIGGKAKGHEQDPEMQPLCQKKMNVWRIHWHTK